MTMPIMGQNHHLLKKILTGSLSPKMGRVRQREAIDQPGGDGVSKMAPHVGTQRKEIRNNKKMVPQKITATRARPSFERMFTLEMK